MNRKERRRKSKARRNVGAPGAQAIELLELARQHHQAGRLSDAEDYYRKVLQVDPENAIATHLLGGIAYQNGDYQAAEDLFRKVVKSNPGDAQAHNHLGNALTVQERPGEAIEHYTKAVERLGVSGRAVMIEDDIPIQLVEVF